MKVGVGIRVLGNEEQNYLVFFACDCMHVSVIQ